MHVISYYTDFIYSLFNNAIITILIITLLNNIVILPFDLYLNNKITVLLNDLNRYIDSFYKLDSDIEKEQHKFKISKIYKKNKKMLMFSGIASLFSLLIFLTSFYSIQNSNKVTDGFLFGLELKDTNSFYIFPIIITIIYILINKHIMSSINLKGNDKNNIQQIILSISFIIMVFGFSIKNTNIVNIFILINEIIALIKFKCKKVQSASN